MFLFVLSVAGAGENDEYDCSDGCGDGCPEKKRGVNFVVVMARCVVEVAVEVPFRTVSIVVAAFPGAILIVAM